MQTQTGRKLMKKITSVCIGLLASNIASAENLEGVDEILCAATQAQICFETGECFSAEPWQLSIPEFVVIDTKEKTVSTTRASGEERSSPFTSYERSDGLIYLQGTEGMRAFSFVIDETAGHLTVAIARDGASVTVFGSCTDTDI
jgi:hypothetical protein